MQILPSLLRSHSDTHVSGSLLRCPFFPFAPLGWLVHTKPYSCFSGVGSGPLHVPLCQRSHERSRPRLSADLMVHI